MAMAETAAFLGFIAPGEFTIIFGGVLAGEGTLSIQLLIGIVWVVVRDRATRSASYLGRRLGRDFALKHGPKVRLTEERFNEGRGLLPTATAARRSSSGAGSACAPADAVHRRRVRHALPALPALRRARRRACGAPTFCLLGLHLLAELRAGRQHRRPGRARASRSCSALFVGGYQAFKRLRHPEQRAGASRAWLERQARAAAAAPAGAGWCAALGVVLRPFWRYVLRPLWRAVAPPLRFLIGAPHAGRARHRADDAAGDRGVSASTWSAADRPARDRRAAARRQHGARHRARHRDRRC